MWLTAEDISRRIGAAKLVELADEDRDGVADAAVLEYVLSEAEGRVQGALKRYVLPTLPPWPAMLVGLGVDVAVSLLQLRRPATYIEFDRMAWEDTQRRLVRIMKGDETLDGMTLRGESASVAAPANCGGVRVAGKPATMACGF